MLDVQLTKTVLPHVRKPKRNTDLWGAGLGQLVECATPDPGVAGYRDYVKIKSLKKKNKRNTNLWKMP